MKLEKQTITRITEELRSQGIRNPFLLRELCDHIASDMEQIMDQGITEKAAWDTAFHRTSVEEIETTRKSFSGILNARYFRIKLFLWITFGLFAISWLFSIGTSQIVSLISFVSLGTTGILLSLDFFRSRRNHPSNTWFGAGIMLGFILVLWGYILFFLVVNFGINTRGHGVDLMIFSYLITSLALFLYFIRQRKLSLSKEGRKELTWFALFCGVQLGLSVLSFLSLPFYRWAVDYIWILIWTILAVNIVSLILLLLRRIRNILFFVLLTLSFMITFIHSPLRRLLPGGLAPAPVVHAAIHETSGQQMEGTWLRIGPQGPVSLTFSADGTVSCDFGMDQSVEIVSAYTLNDHTISSTDIQGVTCPGSGGYTITETGYYLGLDLKNDSWAGNRRPATIFTEPLSLAPRC